GAGHAPARTRRTTRINPVNADSNHTRDRRPVFLWRFPAVGHGRIIIPIAASRSRRTGALKPNLIIGERLSSSFESGTRVETMRGAHMVGGRGAWGERARTAHTRRRDRFRRRSIRALVVARWTRSPTSTP